MVSTPLFFPLYAIPVVIGTYATVGLCLATVPLLKQWPVMAAYRNAKACRELARETEQDPDCPKDKTDFVRDLTLRRMRMVDEMTDIDATGHLLYSMLYWPSIVGLAIQMEIDAAEMRRMVAVARKKRMDRP